MCWQKHIRKKRKEKEKKQYVVSQVCGHCENFNSDLESDSGMIEFV